MFSIIIPLYNKAPYIEKAIQSVLAQTFQEFELIVVDDGSKDNSFEIADKFKSSKVQIARQPNCGVSTARNNGVKVAKYNYIAFLDADDWWEPTFLEEMKALITEFPEGALYASSYFKVKSGKNIPAKIGVPNGFERGYFDYCKTYAASSWMPVWTGATIVKKSVFEEMNGFKPALKLGEDFDLWLRIALKYKLVLLHKPLAYYNQDVDILSRGVVNDKIYDPATHFIFNLDYIQEEAKNPDLKQLLDNLRVYTLMRYYIKNCYSNNFEKEIRKVDFSKQPKAIQRFYRTPKILLKVKNQLIVKLYNAKNYFRK